MQTSRTSDQDKLSFITRPITQLGAWVIESLEKMGHFSSFLLLFFYWCFRAPFRPKIIFEQIYFIGNKSLVIIALSGSFTGMVLAYQTYFGFKFISVDSLVGPFVALSLAKELAPVLAGLIVAGKAGASMAAQLGTMKVTEQVDALEVMGINSYQYLAVPRILATTLAMPILSIYFMLVGNLGAWAIGILVFMIDETLFYSKLGEFLFLEDIAQGLIKSFIFGFFIAVIGTYYGLNATKGAEGVGKGTNQAVVWGMIAVLVLDFFVTSYLVHIL